jgi:Domain of unknown function (DUF5916)
MVDPETVARPEAVAVRSTSPIVVDGRLDEAGWAAAHLITQFYQAQPTPGAPASEHTVARILYDDRNLYIGAFCYDSDPTGLVVKTLERDYPDVLSEEMDSFGVTLDTFLDRRNSFIFFVNPRGGLKDGQGFNDGRSRDYGWDGIVHVRTTVHDSGWAVEIAIPWKTLRFDPSRTDQEWGINLLRRIRRKNEVAYWAPLDRRDRFFRMSRAGTVHGLPTVPRSRNLTLTPYVLAGRAAGSTLAEEDLGNEFEGGFDVKFGVTPRVTLDLTVNTDFSQVEVDQERVNLTRFPLFFPERRDFFLENSGIFTLGDVDGGPGSPRMGTSTRDFTLFHSREIGLLQGNPITLLAGGRVTGRAGGFEFGALDVQTGRFQDHPPENFGVVRLRRNILGSSDVGFLLANRIATDDPTGLVYNRSYGADANLRVAGGLFINTYIAGSNTGGETDEAARLSVGWRDRLWDVSAMVRHVGDDFTPGIGFIRRRGIRQAYATFGLHPRPPVRSILEVNPFVEGHYITDLDGTLLTRAATAAFGVSFTDGSNLSVRYTDRYELLEEPFVVRAGSVVPIGEYRFGEWLGSVSSNEAKRLSGSVAVSGGGFFDGSRFTVAGTTRLQASYHLTVDLEAEHNHVTAGGGSFDADLFSGKIKYAFTTTLYLGAFVQYNADVDQIVTNVRFHFIHAPLSDFFVVYTERYDVAHSAVLERFITAKLTKLFAF